MRHWVACASRFRVKALPLLFLLLVCDGPGGGLRREPRSKLCGEEADARDSLRLPGWTLSVVLVPKRQTWWVGGRTQRL